MAQENENRYFAIEERRYYRKWLSETMRGSRGDLLGYQPYLIDPENNIFSQGALEKGKITINDIMDRDDVRQEIGDVCLTYDEAKNVLKENGATHCIYCGRSIDECMDYEDCEKHTRLKP